MSEVPGLANLPDLEALHEGISDGDIYDALKQSRGNVSEAADALGFSFRVQLQKRIDKNPTLVALCEELRDRVIDRSESHLFADAERGDAAAYKFVLGTIGKSRGYTQGVVGEKGGAIEVIVRKISDG